MTHGPLFAIGGRENRDDRPVVLQRFVDLCGGVGSRLLVVTTATDSPDEKTEEYEHALRSLGVKRLTIVHPDTRERAATPSLLAALNRCDGVFFSGGSQSRLVSTLAGTAFDNRLRLRHAQGLPVGGTSAGASAMSEVMISGGKGGSAPRRAAVSMAPGFGYLRGIIVDQHFSERDRIGRLVAAVLSNPTLLGFGLDEDTAFELSTSDRLTVYGSGTLTIVDGASIEASDAGAIPACQAPAFAGIRLHALRDGWSYSFEDRRVVAA